MAMGGREFLLLLAVTTVGGVAGAAEPGVQRTSYAAAGHVVMPHPNACACSNEEKSHREKLWDRLRPGHRERYVTQQHVRHLHHPECPPYCMENFGYYQTCWRRFPEHTLGCRYCADAGTPPLPAAPLPIPAAPAPIAPAPAPAPTLPSHSPGELKTIPPLEYDTPPPVEPEVEDVKPTITPTGAWWNDPEWQAGLRSASRSSAGVAIAAESRTASKPNFNDPAWQAGLRPAK